MLAQCCAVSAELTHRHVSLSCSGLVCQAYNCMLCKPRAEVLMQKHQKHIWDVFSWHRPEHRSISASSCAPLTSKAHSIEILWQKMLCLQLAELRKKLEDLYSTASADHLVKVDLESRQHRLHGDSSRLEKRLAVIEADRESLSHQLKASCIPVCPFVWLSVFPLSVGRPEKRALL